MSPPLELTYLAWADSENLLISGFENLDIFGYLMRSFGDFIKLVGEGLDKPLIGSNPSDAFTMILMTINQDLQVVLKFKFKLKNLALQELRR